MNFTYSPGPTNTSNNVMLARAKNFTNPDLDPNFFEQYKSICENLQKIFKTKNHIIILSGEGIIGLEACCACLTEKNDNVLVISNGVFGKGFKDLVELYDGNVTLFESPNNAPFSMEDFKTFLQSNNNFKYATLVHCDTPSSMLNPIHEICTLLKSYNILTVVDMVASLGGSPVNVDDSKIDIALCASQKCFSTPPGLTFLSISKDTINAIENRKSKIPTYYMNFLNYLSYYEKKWFPYTMPISDLNGLETSINNILNEGLENVLMRHKKISTSLLKALKENNIQSFLPESCSSETVSTILLEENIKTSDILTYVKEKYNILLSGSFDFLKDKVIRIGHMGENARYEKIIPVLSALESAFSYFYKREINLVKSFNKYYNETK